MKIRIEKTGETGTKIEYDGDVEITMKEGDSLTLTTVPKNPKGSVEIAVTSEGQLIIYADPEITHTLKYKTSGDNIID